MQKRWLWECQDVQEDLLILQDKYKQLGYDLKKEQAYDAWAMYCEYCSANWMYVDGDISNSLWAVKKVLGINQNKEKSLSCVVGSSCVHGLFEENNKDCREKCNQCNEYSNYYPRSEEKVS